MHVCVCLFLVQNETRKDINWHSLFETENWEAGSPCVCHIPYRGPQSGKIRPISVLRWLKGISMWICEYTPNRSFNFHSCLPQYCKYHSLSCSNLKPKIYSWFYPLPYPQHPTSHLFPSLSPLKHIPSFHLMAPSLLTVNTRCPHLCSDHCHSFFAHLSSLPLLSSLAGYLGTQMESFHNNPLLCYNPFKGIVFLWVNPKTLLGSTGLAWAIHCLHHYLGCHHSPSNSLGWTPSQFLPWDEPSPSQGLGTYSSLCLRCSSVSSGCSGSFTAQM